MFSRFNAKLLAADEAVQIIEGEWPRDKTVIMEFETEKEARAFQTGPDYCAIAG